MKLDVGDGDMVESSMFCWFALLLAVICLASSKICGLLLSAGVFLSMSCVLYSSFYCVTICCWL